MKNNIFKHIFLAVTLILGLASCEDRDIITVDNVSAPIVMDLSTTNLVLDKNFPSNPALTVNWAPAKASVPVELKYMLEISGNADFASPTTLATKDKSETVVTFTTKEMNEAAKKIGLVPDESQKMYFRVTSYLGTGAMMQQSQITSLNITPYLASPTYEYQDLYILGASTAAGWDNNNAWLVPLLKTANPNKYTFTGYFKKDIADAGFKIIKERGSWDAQFGAGASEGTLSADGGSGNLQVPADGYYKLSVDIDALTYTLEPVTVTSPVFGAMSIIGTVNGNYDTDTDMIQSTFDPHLWKISNQTLSAGDFKFRADHSWDNNWGTNSEYFGTATKDGANIPLTAEWNYDVYFNDATGDYSIIPVK